MHALAFSDRRELSGRYADTTRENFTNTMVISCFSFTEIAKRAAALMPNGGSLLTLTYGGATRWCRPTTSWASPRPRWRPPCAIWPPISAPQGIRVNALSAGPMRTLAGAGVSDARMHLQLSSASTRRCGARRRWTRWAAPALYLLSDLSGAVTGEVHFVDCGYNTVAMPSLDALKARSRPWPCRRVSAEGRGHIAGSRRRSTAAC